MYSYISTQLKYCPTTGNFKWKTTNQGRRKGQIAGYVMKKKDGMFYRSISFNGKNYLAHRLAFLLINRVWPSETIDHNNGNGLDNRWMNLTEMTQAENNKNRHHLSRNNTTGITGVYWCKTRENWRVVLANKTLGRFSTLLDACCCRITANFTNGYNNTHGKI